MKNAQETSQKLMQDQDKATREAEKKYNTERDKMSAKIETLEDELEEKSGRVSELTEEVKRYE